MFFWLVKILLQQNVRSFKVTSQVYIDVSHGEKPFGRIEIGLFSEDAPKTVENFRESNIFVI